jgi:fermentation-respiration switch protein FrsA (DUF1100 family)
MPVAMISGELDRLVPPYVAHDYARAVLASGPAAVELIDVVGAGHFDLVTPGTQAWAAARRAILAALAEPRGGGYLAPARRE